MISDPILRAAVLVSGLLLAASPSTATDPSMTEGEHLPTPYTAEQIRDATPLGLEIVTRTTTPDGETLSLGSIVERSEEGATFSSRELDAGGEPTGEPTTGSATWEELRRHALFPADRTTRERTTRATELGELEGWLYVIQAAEGSVIQAAEGSVIQAAEGSVIHGAESSVTELFFADAYPGSPVVYEHRRGGEVLLRAEQVERRPPT